MAGKQIVKPSPQFSQSADRNKDVILEQLRRRLSPGSKVLEIASGTGQHALHFARNMADIVWQPSDRDLDEYDLREAVTNGGLVNLRPPTVLDVTRFPDLSCCHDAVYSANCIHIMPPQNLAPYVTGAAMALRQGGIMMLYGPFRYGGEFTTESNRQFDAFLRESYDGGGIRDFEAVDRIAQSNGLIFLDDIDMPANNQFIVWQKSE